MRVKLQTFWRYRPRILTLAVLIVIAAMLVLSNMTVDGGWAAQTHFYHGSYGWPLIWNRYVSLDGRTIGWYYSALRFAGNLAMWLSMMAVPAAACEWLLRRYRPRLRWSLRTMLAAVGLLAMFIGWFAAERNRADLEDPLLPSRLGLWPSVTRVKRWGPQWLGLLGLDRYRRRFATVDLINTRPLSARDAKDHKLLRRLTTLPELRHLTLSVDRVSPSMAAALNEMPKLRYLQIERHAYADEEGPLADPLLPALGKMTQLRGIELSEMVIDNESLANLPSLKSLAIKDLDWGFDEDDGDRVLEAIGRLTQLEHVDLSDIAMSSKSLRSLAKLANLKSLSLDSVVTKNKSPLLSLPAFPELEVFDLGGFDIGDDDLVSLAALPRLKALFLNNTSVTVAGLAQLQSLKSLEELSLFDDGVDSQETCISAAGLESLVELPRLKLLHLGRANAHGRYRYSEVALDDGDELQVLADDMDAFQLAMQALRRSHPGIVIDGDRFPISRDRHGVPTIYCDVDSEPGYVPSWPCADDRKRMTATELSEFESAGGWANFHGAGMRNPDGHTITACFD